MIDAKQINEALDRIFNEEGQRMFSGMIRQGIS